MNPPLYQLYDLQADPHEWNDLSDNPRHASTKNRLITALHNWQEETRDPLADPDKLRQLLLENRAVFEAGRKSPKEGWQYLKYLAPDNDPVLSPDGAAAPSQLPTRQQSSQLDR